MGGFRKVMEDMNICVEEFSLSQEKIIRKGLNNNVDVALYANPKFNDKQMKEIYLGLTFGLNTLSYLNEDIDHKDMKKIRINLMLDEMSLTKKEILSSFNVNGVRQMNKIIEELIELHMLDKMDIVFGRQYCYEQVREIKIGLIYYNVDVTPFITTKHTSLQISKIMFCLLSGLDATKLSNPNFDVMQMEEITSGLRNGLEVDFYANTKYNHRQMKEIRLAMMNGIDIGYFHEGQSDQDMFNFRLHLEVDEGILHGDL
ncbi:MAG: hypothetical protein R3Y64_09965 [Peptostreptococcaceae bacterium]